MVAQPERQRADTDVSDRKIQSEALSVNVIALTAANVYKKHAYAGFERANASDTQPASPTSGHIKIGVLKNSILNTAQFSRRPDEEVCIQEKCSFPLSTIGPTDLP